MSQDKVNFLIVGAQKSGTTALDKYLRGHNEVAMALRKELHFFDNDKFFNQSTVDYSIYHRFFPKNNMKIKGECTPIYMYLPPVMRRVYEYNSKMKIIAILRNPLQRAFSGWNMQHIRKVDNLDFSSAIRNEASRCREALPDYHRDFSYISRGFYSEQIRRIWHFFPKEQTLFIKHEDLKNSPNVVLEKLSALVGKRNFSYQLKTMYFLFQFDSR